MKIMHWVALTLAFVLTLFVFPASAAKTTLADYVRYADVVDKTGVYRVGLLQSEVPRYHKPGGLILIGRWYIQKTGGKGPLKVDAVEFMNDLDGDGASDFVTRKHVLNTWVGDDEWADFPLRFYYQKELRFTLVAWTSDETFEVHATMESGRVRFIFPSDFPKKGKVMNMDVYLHLDEELWTAPHVRLAPDISKWVTGEVSRTISSDGHLPHMQIALWYDPDEPNDGKGKPSHEAEKAVKDHPSPRRR